VALKVAGVGEHLATVLAGILADFFVTECPVTLKTWSPGEGSRTQLTLVLVGRVPMARHQMVIQSVSHTQTTLQLHARNIKYM
jgi:hypothetical protein